jgi:hypothetical protein
VSGLVACILALALGQEAPKAAGFDGIRKGMTAAEVRRILGDPSTTSRQILFRRHVEQWRFAANDGWIELNCVRGEEPYVSNVYHRKKRQ